MGVPTIKEEVVKGLVAVRLRRLKSKTGLSILLSDHLLPLKMGTGSADF